MEDIKQDVTSESSTEQEVNEVEETTNQESSPDETNEQEQVDPSTPEDVKPEGQEEVDERGVSWKNRAMENQRKLDEVNTRYNSLETRLPEMLEQVVAKVAPQQSQPKYSKEELIRFKNSDNASSEHRAWAEIELDKIRQEETRKYFDDQRAAETQKHKLEQAKQMTYGQVRNKYGVMFNPDGSWNNNHPLTQLTAQVFNSDKELVSNPRGLLAAANEAFSIYAMQQQPHLLKQNQQMKRKVKKLQKATLVEGGGQPVQQSSKDSLTVAKQNLAANYTGRDNKKALKSVVAEMLRRNGKI